MFFKKKNCGVHFKYMSHQMILQSLANDHKHMDQTVIAGTWICDLTPLKSIGSNMKDMEVLQVMPCYPLGFHSATPSG